MATTSFITSRGPQCRGWSLVPLHMCLKGRIQVTTAYVFHSYLPKDPLMEGVHFHEPVFFAVPCFFGVLKIARPIGGQDS